MRESVRLGTIAGVRIGLNFSVLVILAILVVGLAAGRFPAAFPGHTVVAYLAAAGAAAILFSPSDVSRAIQLRDLRPFDPYQGPRGADLSALPGSRT